MSKNNNQSKTIILVDSSIPKNELTKFVEHDFYKIISFDISSHTHLLDQNIEHDLSDNFLKKLDLDYIQKKSYELSKWANSQILSEYLIYDGFNLGHFFYHEIFTFLLPFLKKFLEIEKIVNQYPNHFFISSDVLNQIILSVGGSGKVIENSEFSKTFLYDSLEFQNNLIKIRFSRKNYLRLKNLFEKCIDVFFKPKNINDFKNTLLIEFNTKQYAPIFLSLKKYQLTPIHYGRKRPALWDKKSFSIIKKSKTLVITENSLLDQNTNQQIIEQSTSLTENIILKLNETTFFNDFFTFNGISFWEIIKDSFLILCKNRIKEAIKELYLAKKTLYKTNPKSILVLSEIGYTEQFVIHYAKKLQIPVVLLQHGVGAFDSPESDEINEFTGSMPILSDLYFVWGDATEKYAKTFGIPDIKVKSLGSSAHDYTFNNKDIFEKQGNEFILLATGAANHDNVNEYLVKTTSEYENTLRKICQVISDSNKKLIIKIHPYVDSSVEEKIAKDFPNNVSIIKKGDILELIDKCEFMVVLSMTSAILDAQILNTPVLRFPLKEWYGTTNFHRHEPGYTVTIDNFENIFHKLLTDIDFKNSIIAEGKQFVNDCLTNQGDAADNIAKFLQKM